MSLHHRTVISFLSPSAAASRVAQEKLSTLLGWKAVNDVAANTSSSVDCVGLQCPSSGTVLQWLSFDPQSERQVNERNPFRILAVQETSVGNATKELEQALESTSSSTKIRMKRMFRQPLTAKDLLGRGSLPLLQWKKVTQQPKEPFVEGFLKEIALPTFDDAQYSDGRTLREHLSAAPLHRPATGLYQLANGLCLRPLPTGVEDRKLSPPSLVFHSDLEKLPWVKEQPDGQIASTSGDFDVFRIGFNGIGKGQLMVRSHDWWGMDLRFCEQAKHRAVFNEAQEALLAGSLPSLQSTHVLDGAQETVDPRTDKMDCWVEFRASVRNPVGFWSRRSSSKPRIAKIPDLPYE